MKKNKNNNNENMNNIFAILAIVLVVAAIANFGITFVKLSEIKKEVTGFATGFVNITVSTNIGVDISPTWGINWSAGGVNSGANNATLTTTRNTSNVVDGNWSTTAVQGILITNTGNVNCSLHINGSSNRTDLFGTGTNGASNYSWNVSTYTATDLGAVCSGGQWPLNQWLQMNHTKIKFCAQMNSEGAKNQVWLDVQLRVPKDTANTGVNLADTLTITAEPAG